MSSGSREELCRGERVHGMVPEIDEDPKHFSGCVEKQTRQL
ncbi:hypothetical protein HMPREF0294_0913 [Corynebacterium glucuronolyticum ATCC 51867]|nr:hypothetical protein HMPREF0294_0913 [Corynebacterium glucuronolyticum ATCC 51867]